MDKSGLIKRWGRKRQSIRFILTAITIIVWSTFYQVLAAPMERVLPPHELLNHRQFGGGVIQPITPRSDTALHGNSVDSVHPASGRNEHALSPDLAGAQGSEVQKLPLRTDGLPSAIVKGNAVDLQQQMASSSTARVLDGYGHRQWIPRLDDFMPLVDKPNRYNDATGPHALVKILGENTQVLSGDTVRSGGDDIGMGRAFVSLSRGLQTLIGDPVRQV